MAGESACAISQQLLPGDAAIGCDEDAHGGVSKKPVMNPVPGEAQDKSKIFAHKPQLVWPLDPRGYQ